MPTNSLAVAARVARRMGTRVVPWAVALAVLPAWVAPTRVWAAPQRVALVVHPVVNVSEADSKPIVADLAAALRKRFDAEFVAGDAVRSKLPANLPEDCVSDAHCIGEVGDRVGADQLLFLVMVRVGTKIQINPTWAEIQSGRALPRDPVELDDKGPSRASVMAEVAPSMIPRGSLPLHASAVAKAPASGGGGGVETKAENRLPPVSTSDPWRSGKTTDTDLYTIAWGTAGVAAAALGVGVALVLGGLADYNEQIELGCPLQDDPRGSCIAVTERFATRSTVANLLLVGGGLAAATSVALFIAGAQQEEALAASLVVSPDGVALTWGGRF